ncbi:hypothetical protein NIIDMKKI_64030 [Mycobacterium kansasii]|uniref:UvrD-like helicase ATP-binding domain-containing protein n=1 Tax=Mycobacterium kansasii TaxID=1768 RepID=A0A7G1IK92_MYCKA|nr:hypothetical protein NIIDMKKI_64030 [Mycobacterium kansasii]
MERFDLLGPLPAHGATIVLEASAGTGKTFALAGLVTRYLAETDVTLDEMLLITFNRAASRELRERVRDQIVAAVAALDGRMPTDTDLVRHLLGSEAERAVRLARLRDALANFDAATIATTHEFCGSVLRSLVWRVTAIPASPCGRASTIWWPRSSTTATSRASPTPTPIRR